MLDEIYLRLLLELMPASLKLNNLDMRRLLEQFNHRTGSSRAYGQLIKEVYLDNPNTDFGLYFGDHLHPATLCDQSRAFMTAPSVKDIFKLIDQYHYIQGASYYLLTHTTDEAFSISMTYPYKRDVSTLQKRFCAEALFSYVINLLRETVCPSIIPTNIQFDFDKPEYATSYEQKFKCKPIFNSHLSMITFEAEVLNRTLLTSNQTLHLLYLNKTLDTWQKSDRLQDFEYRTICQLMRHHPESFSSQKIASRLNISVRGLQKRLNKHDQSLSSLSNLARRELAKVYLFQKNQDIDFTAEQLGFQTTSGFRRFFKTEFDQTPIEYLANCSVEPS
jgi:AraC-like DNA-binding protein